MQKHTPMTKIRQKIGTGSRLRYLIEIWYTSRFPSSLTRTITKTENGSRFPTLWPPFWKIDILP